MRHIPFLSRDTGIAPALFFMLCLLTLVFSPVTAAAGGGKPGPGFGPGPGQTAGVYAGPGPAGTAASYGAYTGPGPAPVTVKQALSMGNKDWVVLNGVISQSLGGNRYTFADSSGTIEADIGPKEWMWVNRQIGASDTVEIQGYIHSDWKRPYNHVHVKRITAQ